MFLERDEGNRRTKVGCDAALCDEKLWVTDEDLRSHTFRKGWAMEETPIGGKPAGFFYCPDHKRQDTGL